MIYIMIKCIIIVSEEGTFVTMPKNLTISWGVCYLCPKMIDLAASNLIFPREFLTPHDGDIFGNHGHVIISSHATVTRTKS